MSPGSLGLLLAAAVLVLLAGVWSAVDAALAGFSRARAQELEGDGRAGAGRLVQLLEDPRPPLNTVILLRLLSEISAIVLVTQVVRDGYGGAFWPAALTSISVMLVLSFVVIGVAPRTLGRQHSDTIALLSAAPVNTITSILGPVPRLLILIGNAITPGRGFREGPFQTETELRELVDIAEQSALIEAGERRMIHSVFELGDTVAREVMVPRDDIVFIEHFKNLRQTLSLFLRSGYSRMPVVGENLDDVKGFAYLKDIVQRDFDAPDVEFTEKVSERLRAAYFVPESKPVDALLTEMQANHAHIAMVIDEYGGVCGLITIEDILEEIVGEITDEYDAEAAPFEMLSDGSAVLSPRFPIEDLDEVFGEGYDIEDEDIDSVGGLMAKHLGRVPIHGSVVSVDGLIFEARGTTGRRNRIDSVLVSKVPEPTAPSRLG